MKKLFFILPLLLAGFFCQAQTGKGYSFCTEYIAADRLLAISLQYNQNVEKTHLFLREVNQCVMNAKDLFSSVKGAQEQEDLQMSLDFMQNRSLQEYLEPNDVFKITMWRRLNETKMKQILPKIMK